MTPVVRPELLFNAGVAYGSLGRTGEALREAEALRSVDPVLARRLRDFIASAAPRDAR
jgi:hypothetical protein